MTINYHTPIATNSPLNAAVLEAPLSALDSALTNYISGATSLTGLNLGAAGALTISGGSVTRTGPRHTIDTESSATTDDLTTIGGGTTGDILIISGANASRVVTVKHGTGNIFLYSKMDKAFDDTDKQIALVYNGSRWEELNGQPTTAVTYPTAAPFRRPATMPMMMTPAARNFFMIRAAAATVAAMGIAAPTVTGNTASNQADSTYIAHQTGAASGNSAGIVTATYNLVRRSHNPKFSAVIQFTSITAVRGFWGFCSAALTSADTIAGATEAAMFRFSTVAGEAGFIPVTKDATTQTSGSAMNTIAAATRYLLEIELTSSSAIFTVNNGTPVTVTTTLPTTSTELGLNLIVFTTENVLKIWQFSRTFVEFD